MKQWQRVQVGTLRPGEVVDIDGMDTQMKGWPRFDQRSQRWVLHTAAGFLSVSEPIVSVYR